MHFLTHVAITFYFLILLATATVDQQPTVLRGGGAQIIIVVFKFFPCELSTTAAARSLFPPSDYAMVYRQTVFQILPSTARATCGVV